MRNISMQNASRRGGVMLARRAGQAKRLKHDFMHCDDKHITALKQELYSRELSLSNSVGVSKNQCLLNILRYLGNRGLNTIEAAACGFVRVAPRVMELQRAGWHIISIRESVLGDDSIEYHGIARYVFLGRIASDSQQCSFNFDGGLQ